MGALAVGLVNMGSLFHVAQTVPREESLVCANLRALGFEVFHPTKIESRRQRHLGWTQAVVPLFQGYIFVRFDPRADNWRPICAARGVTRLLGPGPEHPKPISNIVMDELMQRHAAGEFQPRPAQGILAGERGRVLTGSFADKVGQCMASGAKRVVLLLELFGGAVPVTFPVDDVVAA